MGEKTGVKGVSWNKKDKKWFVTYRGNYFGSFERIEDAIKLPGETSAITSKC